METWAFCRACDRWYYCPGEVVEDLAHATCPVCDSSPSTYQQRARAEHPAILVD